MQYLAGLTTSVQSDSVSGYKFLDVIEGVLRDSSRIAIMSVMHVLVLQAVENFP